MQVVEIKAEKRAELGKKATKAIRDAGKIPAVVYSVNGVEHFTTEQAQIKSLVYTPDFKLAEIHLDGKVIKAILKDIDFHPVTDRILHMDFVELVEGRKVMVEIPIAFKGVSPGVKSGGRLIKNIRKVKVKVLAENIVDHLEADISSLEMSDAIRIRDLVVPDGLEVQVDPAAPIAVVQVPRAMKSATAAEGEAAVEEEAVEETAE